MSSAEFTRWIAWYRIADGQNDKRDPTPDEVGAKFAAFAELHNSRAAGQVTQERVK